MDDSAAERWMLREDAVREVLLRLARSRLWAAAGSAHDSPSP